jgi:hypothetical protein
MNCLFIDIETKTIKETDKLKIQHFHLGHSIFRKFNQQGDIDVDTSHDLYSTQDLVEVVNEVRVPRKTLNIISCHIWFDVRTSKLLVNLIDEGYTIKFCYCKGLCVIIKLEKGDYRIQILNINQFIPGSVEKYGDLLGKPKLSIDLDDTTDEYLMEYCRRDTEIVAAVFSAWLKFITQHDLGSFGLTIASQAFIAFRKRFMNKKIYIHGDNDKTAFERKAYYGGRTEAFFIGKIPHDKVYILDVNSMYPWVMAKYRLPYKWVGCDNDITYTKLAELLRKYFCIAYVALNTDKPYYPYRTKDKLCFPIGKFQTYLCSPELELAIKHGHILHAVYVMVYERAYIFREYIKYFHTLKTQYKQAHNDLLERVCKLFMNSLYGKFGQRMDSVFMEEWVDNPNYYSMSEIDIDTGITWRKRQLGNLLTIYREGVLDSEHSFPAICAGVTSKARLRLIELMKVCGDGNYFYCDTDSLFVNKVGYRRLKRYLQDQVLGMLEVKQVASEVIIHGCKDYVIDGVGKTKGIPKKAVKVSANSYDTLVFPSFKSDINRGMASDYAIHKVNKTLSRKYDKGVVTASGNVIPLCITQW